MTEQFSITVDWLASDEPNAFERVTSAEVGICAGNTFITNLEDLQAKTVRKTMRVSAGKLAIWLVNNWWRLRWEPPPATIGESDFDWRMAHLLPAIGDGYVWPDCTFLGSDGLEITLSCKQTFADPNLSPVRYLNDFWGRISCASFEESVHSFVGTVLARLDLSKVSGTVLHELYADLRYEQGSVKAATFRKLEALLRLDPDEDRPLVSSLLSKWPKQLGQTAVEEIAAANKPKDIETVLISARKAAETVKTFGGVPRLVGNDASSILQSGQAPWMKGKRLASALREKWEIGDLPITDVMMAERIEIPLSRLRDNYPQSPFSFAVLKKDDGRFGFVLARPREHYRRFDLARLIGDCLSIDSNDLIRPVTTAFTQRQQLQRAFAAELLCPSDVVASRFSREMNRRQTQDVVDELSQEYNVPGEIVVNHMQNKDLLPNGVTKESLLFG